MTKDMLPPKLRGKHHFPGTSFISARFVPYMKVLLELVKTVISILWVASRAFHEVLVSVSGLSPATAR